MNKPVSDKKQEIMSVAMQAFAEKGYDKTSMDDIVKRGNFSKGTMYWYFKSKSDLFAELLEHTTQQWVNAFDGLLNNAEGLCPKDALQAIITEAANMIETNPAFSILTIDFILQALHHDNVREKYMQMYQNYIQTVQKIIQQGIDAGDFKPLPANVVAAVFLSGLDGVSLLSMLITNIDKHDELTIDLRQAILTFGELFIGGLAKQPEPPRY